MANPQRESRTSNLTVVVILIVATLAAGAGYITCKASKEVGETEGTGVDGPGTTPSKR
jgi:hypothetical protein